MNQKGLKRLRDFLVIVGLIISVISGPPAMAKKARKEYPSVFNWGAVKHGRDSLTYSVDNCCPQFLNNKIVIPVTLMAMGGYMWTQRNQVKTMRDTYLNGYSYHIDDYMQYVPGVLVYGLNAVGVKGHHTVSRASLSLGMSLVIMGATVNILKYSVAEPRPDGSANNSFPSGHTAMAFTMATFLHKEYGVYRSPIYSMVGFALAGATGIYRVLNNKHWVSDVMFGAGIGILSTEAGYALTQCMMGDKGTRSIENRKTTRYRTDKPHFTRIYIGRTMPLGDLSDQYSPEIHASHGVEFGMKAGYFITPHWGIGGEINATSFWTHARKDLLNASPGLMGSASALIGPAYSTMVGNYWRVDADLLGGYWLGAKNKITSLDPDASVNGVPLTVTWTPKSSFTCSTSFAIHRMLGSNFGIGAYGRYAIAQPTFSMEYNHPVDDPDEIGDFNWQQWSVGLSLTGYLW
ncbi:phosphatase PAP2 family protein [Halosquirtibacter xylanolyticus]|uniref:phosphatase PAP2 family protein n=1 Tax=Halosquirtibacter xylanolyticus TaxID=3374599 RepID=UPI003748176F|nr:phosphatase PAP2 family protein [Prolixibacteraceae bacterium]